MAVPLTESTLEESSSQGGIQIFKHNHLPDFGSVAERAEAEEDDTESLDE